MERVGIGRREAADGIVSDSDVDHSAGAPVVLETKLATPPVRPEHVPRPHLVDRLREHTSRGIVLVTAPPGFGKTALLAQFTAERADRTAWLTVDDADNDPARFLAHLAAAFRRVHPGAGSHALQAHRTPGAGLIEVVLPLFLNDLATAPTGTTVVLDDFHLITNAGILAAFSWFVERLPHPVALIISTRQDPALPLSRLRAGGRLTELRADDLRFNADESRRFLNDLLSLGLAEPDVALLHARTEGWPAALYLAVLSIQGRPHRSALIETFAGDDRHVVDYLTSEVLARLPTERREFLTRTSILARLCGPLCDAVTSGRGSAATLAELERSNLLVVPLDTKRRWYRYHALFADLLESELARAEPDLVAVLHRRASAWYRAEGLIHEAADHAIKAGDVDAAAELLARHYSSFLAEGQLTTVSRWLEALPTTVLTRDWMLCFAAAMVCSHTGRISEAQQWLDRAEQAPHRPDSVADQLGQVLALRSWLSMLRGGVEHAIGYAREALAASASADPGSAQAPRLLLAAALWWTGASEETTVLAEEIAASARAHDVPAEEVFALGLRAAIELEKGQPAQADALARKALVLVERHGLDEHPFTAMARIVRGAVEAEGDLPAGTAEVERGVRLAERVGAWHFTAFGLLTAAEIRNRQHTPDAARRLLAQTRDLLQSLPEPGAGTARLQASEKTLRLRAATTGTGSPAPFWELSERELAVLRLLASRLSQREIASELYVSFNTVKTHTRSIFRKLGTTSRAEAVDRARQLGLL